MTGFLFYGGELSLYGSYMAWPISMRERNQVVSS